MASSSPNPISKSKSNESSSPNNNLAQAPTTKAKTPSHYRSHLSDFERSDRPAFVLTFTEVKLLGIAGVGFFLDAYDLFIINPVATMLQYRLYGGGPLPANLEGFVKAGANIGSVIGQFAFGYAADALGRKAVYGKELMLIIFATIMTLTTPTGSLSPNACLIYLGIFRILLGVGVGGDYPMSASITSDRANLRKRGTMLAYIFSNQGWGSFVGSLATIVVLACYKNVMEAGKTSRVDGVWRIIIGLSLIPAFGTLYQRLTLPESTRFIASQKINQHHEAGGSGEFAMDDIEELKKAQREEDVRMGNVPKATATDEGRRRSTEEKEPVSETTSESDEKKGDVLIKEEPNTPSASTSDDEAEEDAEALEPEKLVEKKAHFKEFITYFSEWRHAKLLIGTCMCWFLLDIAFYGINLNQNVVLEQMGFAGKEGTPWERLFKVSTGNIIVTALGFVPGYYATILTIEILGRKWIQIQGFLLAALFLAILAARFNELGTVSFIVCFAFLQFFFNFGANATTYCYPAEVFPTRFRASAHGISAASGKAGAIISALAFNTLSKSIGTPAILWIFFGCCIAGAGFTLLLPEVKGRDPDVILAEEIKAARAERAAREAAERKS
ncbi:phosphate transporter [Crucibulum laeve]|uniref:Phosphate transporter n=1 Tax=Crucibulum laeve TaxID=68775 RepID=A0A5C3LXY9_9AGAR|nr:phosphate transporter [Crucibulum laeve]